MPPQKLGTSAAEMRKMIAVLKSHLALGKPDGEIAEEMELEADAFRVLKREMFNREKAELQGKSTEEFFVEYKLRQEGVIAELDRMVRYYSPQAVKVEEGGDNTMMADQFSAARYGGQPSAIVGALRAKSDIIDKIVKVGQEFGVLEKVPEKKLIVGGVAVANMSTEDLRQTIVGAVVGLKKLTARYGDTDVLGNPIGDSKALGPAVKDAELVAPKFSDKRKPKEAIGGRAKAAGAAAVNRKKATNTPADND